VRNDGDVRSADSSSRSEWGEPDDFTKAFQELTRKFDAIRHLASHGYAAGNPTAIGACAAQCSEEIGTLLQKYSEKLTAIRDAGEALEEAHGQAEEAKEQARTSGYCDGFNAGT